MYLDPYGSSSSNTAYNNWWGDASGPYNAASNPTGTGDNITDGVPFSPWATVPFNISFSPPTSQNHPPTISNITAPSKAVVGEKVMVHVTAYDEDADFITYGYSYSDGFGDVFEAGTTLEWTAPTTSGNYTITVKVSDWDSTTTKIVEIMVVNTTIEPPTNHAPIITNIFVNRTIVPANESATITVVASDVDGDNLTYFYSATNGTIYGNDTIAIWTAPPINGTYMITVRVDDGKLNATETINITVANTTSPPITNAPLTAAIVSITPNPAVYNQSVIAFVGSGSDADGTIVEYMWESNISGVIGTSATFTNNSLPVGVHNITFKVKDNNNTWSEPVSITLTINASGGNATITEKPGGQKKGFLPGFETLMLVAAFVVASVYLSRKIRKR
jgi:hypothetical protein